MKEEIEERLVFFESNIKLESKTYELLNAFDVGINDKAEW